MQVSRREWLAGGVGVVCGCVGGAVAARSCWPPSPPPAASSGPVPPPPPSPSDLAKGVPDAQKGLELLKAGNARFAAGKPDHPHASPEWRTEIAAGQHPYAIILGCSDSRLSPEVIFDEGLGELFVVRQAGHVADDDSLGSIEYAVGHLHVPLVVVLGHQNCGAVRAALAAVQKGEPVEGHILRLVDDITPAAQEVQAQPGDVVDLAVRANVRHVVKRLRESEPVLRQKERKGEVRVVGAYYPLATGVVEWLSV